MNSKALRDMKNFASEGRFEELRAALTVADIDRNAFLEILQECSRFCKTNPDEESIDYKVLFGVLKLKVSLAKTIPGAVLDKYLRCLYHCLPVPFREDFFDDLRTLQDLLLPHCTASTSSTIYKSFVKNFHYALLKAPKIMPRIVPLIFQLCKATADPEYISDVTSGMFIQMYQGEHDVERLKECYYCLTDVLRGVDLKEEQLVNNLSLFIPRIMMRYVKSHDFLNVQMFLESVRDDFIYEKYRNLCNILNFIVVLSPLKQNHRCRVLNVAIDSLRKINLKPLIITELYMMTEIILNYYKSRAESGWQEFTGEFKSKLLTFLLELLKFVRDPDSVQETCSCSCTAKKSTTRSLVCFKTMTLLIELSLEDSSPDHATYLNVLGKYSTEIGYLKEHKCTYMAGAWNSIGNSLFTFGERSNNHKYFVMLIKNYFKFQSRRENVTVADLVSKVTSSFRELVSENSQSILSFCALASHLVPSHRNYFLKLWLNMKYKLRDVSPSITMVGAIELLDWTKYDVNLTLTVEERIDLLIHELESCKKYWQSKQSMMAAFKELHAMVDCNKAAEVAVRIFGECDFAVHCEVWKIISKIVTDCKEKAKGIKEKLYLSKLYFMVYKFREMENGRKTCEEIEKNMSYKPMKNQAAEALIEVTEPEDECDIVSSYDALRLDRCLKEWKNLDRSLELLSSQAKRTDLSKFPDLHLYDLLMKISFEYQIHCHHFKTLQALELALKIAQAEDNPSNVIRTVSYLLQISPEWLKVGEEFLPRLDPSNTKTLLIYYINKTSAYLQNDDVETSLESLKLALDLFKLENIEHKDFIRCRLVLLEMKYLDLPSDTCESLSKIVPVHGQMVMAKSRKAYETVIACMKFNRLDVESLLPVLDLVEGIATYYHRMKEPRAVRFFVASNVVFAQKMMLPSRCVSFLAHLAFADIQTGRYEDCYVKLNGMSDILGLPKRSVLPTSEKEVEGVVDWMKGLSLDVPRRCRDESPSKEYLSVQRMEMPPLCQHSNSCECFYCVCLEYQVWVLMAIRLDLVYNQKEKSQAAVSSLRSNADILYDRYLESYRNHSHLRLPLKTIYDYINSELVINYCYILLDHTRFLMATNRRSMAFDTLGKLSSIVVSVKRKCSQLYAETYTMILVLKCGAVAPDALNIPNPQEKNVDDDTGITNETPHTPIDRRKHLPPPSLVIGTHADGSSPEPSLRPIVVPKLVFSPDNNTPKMKTPVDPKSYRDRTKLKKPDISGSNTPKPKMFLEVPEFKTPKPRKTVQEGSNTPKPKMFLEVPEFKTPKPRKTVQEGFNTPKLEVPAFKTPKPRKTVQEELKTPKPKRLLEDEFKTPNPPKTVQEEFKTPKPKRLLEDEFKTPKPPKAVQEEFKTPNPKGIQEEDLKTPKGPQEEPETPDGALTKSARRRGRRHEEESESSTRQTRSRSKLLVEKLKSAKAEREEPKTEEATKSAKKRNPRKNLMF